MFRPRRLFSIVTTTVLVAGLAFGQDREKVKYLTPTIHGSTGLFNIYLADTLRQGEFSVGLHGTKFHREPGELNFVIFPVSFTIGLHDRVELFTSFEAHKRVHAGSIQVNKVAPGGPVVPARLSTGVVAFFNDAPFMDVGFGDGTGDLWAGVKFNLVSERYGGPFGLAVQPKARFHLTDDREHLLRGLTTGATDYGFDVIVSKDIPRGGYFTSQAGVMIAQDRLNVDRQNYVNYGLGVDVPLGSLRAHFITELVGSTFFGSRDTSIFTNPRSPLDWYGGFRVFPARWIALSAAYSFNFKQLDESTHQIPATGRHGGFAQVVFQRKVNRPPTIECTAEQTTVIQGDTATIRAVVNDPDDDVLTITWRSNAGRITQREGVAEFDSTGVAPGRYTVIGEVTDGENVATCSVDITVERRRQAPTVVCEPANVNVTEGDSTTLRVQATDPNNLRLTYRWTVNGQAVVNDAPELVFGTAGRTPGTYTVQVTVTNEDNLSASCQFTVNVQARAIVAPTVTLTLDKTEVFAGEIVTATATASHPEGEALTYAWTVDGQGRSETTSQIQINTTGMAGGPHTVTVTVTAERGGKASDTKSFSVREKIIIQMDGVRPDNRAKALLDEVALKMQGDPRLRALVTGHTDDRGTAEANMRVGQRRADSVKDYLVTQHKIDPNRIETQSKGQTEPIADNTTAEGRRQNRRVEVELYVP